MVLGLLTKKKEKSPRDNNSANSNGRNNNDGEDIPTLEGIIVSGSFDDEEEVIDLEGQQQSSRSSKIASLTRKRNECVDHHPSAPPYPPVASPVISCNNRYGGDGCEATAPISPLSSASSIPSHNNVGRNSKSKGSSRNSSVRNSSKSTSNKNVTSNNSSIKSTGSKTQRTSSQSMRSSTSSARSSNKQIKDGGAFGYLIHSIILIGVIWPLAFVFANLWVLFKPLSPVCVCFDGLSRMFERSTNYLLKFFDHDDDRMIL